jgi:hypothetical protein
MHPNLLNGQFASEPKRWCELEAIALLGPLDAVPVNKVLSLRVFAMQTQALVPANSKTMMASRSRAKCSVRSAVALTFHV